MAEAPPAVEQRKSAAAGTTSSGRPRLTQLAGVRTCASLWIVLGHFMGEPRVPGGRLINRGCVPVEVFIVLSGFVTHYAYVERKYESAAAVARFYGRRFGAVLFSYYATWVVMLAFSIGACASGACITNDHMLDPWWAVSRGTLSLLMLQSFEPLEPIFPHGPAWTISTMGLLWLLYPALKTGLAPALRARPALVLAVACLVTQAPPLIALAWPMGGHSWFVSEYANLWLYHFPAFRLGDFAFGMALAQLVLDQRWAPTWKGWGIAADAAVVAAWAACACLPADTRGLPFPAREGWEPLFNTALQPLIGLFLFASSCPGATQAPSVRFVRHPVMAGLGEYTFQVYLWHWPLGMLFKGAELSMTGNTANGLAGPFLLPFVIASWTLSAAVSAYAEEPFRAWLRKTVDAWADAAEARAALTAAAKRTSADPSHFAHAPDTPRAADTAAGPVAQGTPTTAEAPTRRLLEEGLVRSDDAAAAGSDGSGAGGARLVRHGPESG